MDFANWILPTFIFNWTSFSFWILSTFIFNGTSFSFCICTIFKKYLREINSLDPSIQIPAEASTRWVSLGVVRAFLGSWKGGNIKQNKNTCHFENFYFVFFRRLHNETLFEHFSIIPCLKRTIQFIFFSKRTNKQKIRVITKITRTVTKRNRSHTKITWMGNNTDA